MLQPSLHKSHESQDLPQYFDIFMHMCSDSAFLDDLSKQTMELKDWLQFVVTLRNFPLGQTQVLNVALCSQKCRLIELECTSRNM